jgi:hypothetical protein
MFHQAVIAATQEKVIRRITVLGQSRQKVIENSYQTIKLGMIVTSQLCGVCK